MTAARPTRPPLHWSSEMQLLIDLTRARPKPGITVPQNCHWPEFLKLTRRHRLGALVATRLKDQPEVPTAVAGELSELLQQAALTSLAHTRAQLQVIAAFNAAGIDCMVMKGDAVSARFYAAQHERQSIDIDILIAPGDLARAQEVLKSLSFFQSSPEFEVASQCYGVLNRLRADLSFERTKDHVQLELHWRMTSNPKILNWRFDAWELPVTQMDLQGKAVCVLQPPAQFIYLICHGAKHAWHRLKWLADIDRILDQLSSKERQDAVAMAWQTGTQRMLATSLYLHQLVYGTPAHSLIDEPLQREIDPYLLDHMIETLQHGRTFDAIRLTDLRRLWRSFRFYSRLRPDLPHKAWTLLQHLVDVKDINTLKLSERWLWLYIALGPFLNLFRAARRQLMPGS